MNPNTPIDKDDIALVTCIDANKKIVVENDKLAFRYFEYEAIRCFQHWRRNGGWLKDISIYCLNPKHAKLTRLTLQTLSKLNVKYVEHYDRNVATSTIEFIDKLYSQQFFENTRNVVKEKYLIYLDLDVFLLKPFPYFLFEYAKKDKILLARHDKVNDSFDKDFLYRYQNITNILGGNCYNAYFVVENKQLKFFSTLYGLIYSKKYKQFYDDIVLLHENGRKNDYYLFEESLYDYQWHLKLFGDRIMNLNISDIENVYFKHQHIMPNEIVKLLKGC